MAKKTSIIWTMEKERMQNIINESSSVTEVLGKLGFSKTSAGCFTYLKERIERDGLDLSKLEEKRHVNQQKHLEKLHSYKRSLGELLVKNSKADRVSLKQRLIREGLLEEKCAECGVGSEWNGKPLSLQLDHVNGVNDDNRLCNLRLLCPNCHSQTETFGGRKRKKTYNCVSCSVPVRKRNQSGLCVKCVAKETALINRKVQNRPSRKELIELITTKPFVQIGNDYGVSDNAIRKWCKSYGLPHRSCDIKAQKDVLLQELTVSVIRD